MRPDSCKLAAWLRVLTKRSYLSSCLTFLAELSELKAEELFCRVKLGPVVSEWEKVSRGCPLGSAFGPLLWSIYQNDLTYDIDVSLNMYADDHQFYAMNNDIEVVNDNLTHSATNASEWYTSNFLKGNLDNVNTLFLWPS